MKIDDLPFMPANGLFERGLAPDASVVRRKDLPQLQDANLDPPNGDRPVLVYTKDEQHVGWYSRVPIYDCHWHAIDTTANIPDAIYWREILW